MRPRPATWAALLVYVFSMIAAFQQRAFRNRIIEDVRFSMLSVSAIQAI